MKTSKQLRVTAWWVGAAAATTLGVVACGSDFNGSEDCKASRTCAAAGGETAVDGGAPSGNAPSAGGADVVVAAGNASGGAADTAPIQGGAGGVAVAETGGAGGAVEPECRVAKDCSNADPTDGEELCDNGSCAAGNAPPTVVSVTPADKALGIAPDGSIVLQFSEPLDPNTAIAANVQLLDGATVVPVDVTYVDSKVTIKPKTPLALLTPYSVSASVKVTDVAGAGLLAPFKSTFVVRDGVWSVKTAVTDNIYQVGPSLPVTDDGQALVTWIAIASPGHYCPTTARWFSQGASVGLAKKLTGDDIQDCATVRAAGTGDGSAVISWREDAGTYAVTYRAGAWQSKLPLSANPSVYQAAVAQGPGDEAHYLEVQLSGGVDAYWWDVGKGKWTNDPFHVSTEAVLSEPQMAVAKNGRVYAVWRARNASNSEKVSSAMYDPDVKKWLAATDVKGSTAAITGAGYERGAPSIAVDENGDAMALWVRGSGTTYQLAASRYRYAGTGWEDPIAISGTLAGIPRTEPAALVFDGKTYVAAWTALVGSVNNTYVARFDRKSEAWNEYKLVSDGIVNSAARMPRLGADAHQNLLVTWPAVTNVANVFNLTYQRFNASTGTWATAAAVSDGSMSDSGLAVSSAFPLAVSSNGPAAATWGTKSAGGFSAIQLASFY
jgi:Bacterial Ig-like domain